MQNKKKILFVVESMATGIFTYIINLINRLVENYDVYIAYAVRSQTPSNYKDYFYSRVHLINVKKFSCSINLVKDILAFFEAYLKIIKKFTFLKGSYKC